MLTVREFVKTFDIIHPIEISSSRKFNMVIFSVKLEVWQVSLTESCSYNPHEPALRSDQIVQQIGLIGLTNSSDVWSVQSTLSFGDSCSGLRSIWVTEFKIHSKFLTQIRNNACAVLRRCDIRLTITCLLVVLFNESNNQTKTRNA